MGVRGCCWCWAGLFTVSDNKEFLQRQARHGEQPPRGNNGPSMPICVRPSDHGIEPDCICTAHVCCSRDFHVTWTVCVANMGVASQIAKHGARCMLEIHSEIGGWSKWIFSAWPRDAGRTRLAQR